MAWHCRGWIIATRPQWNWLKKNISSPLYVSIGTPENLNEFHDINSFQNGSIARKLFNQIMYLCIRSTPDPRPPLRCSMYPARRLSQMSGMNADHGTGA